MVMCTVETKIPKFDILFIDATAKYVSSIRLHYPAKEFPENDKLNRDGNFRPESVHFFIFSGVLGVFIWSNDTPVVRASGRELSYVILFGTLLCYMVTFMLMVRPTHLVCAIQVRKRTQ